MEIDQYTLPLPMKENVFILGILHESPLSTYHNGEQDKTHKARVTEVGKVEKPRKTAMRNSRERGEEFEVSKLIFYFFEMN